MKTVILTAFIGSGATTLLGLIGALRSLSQKPGPYLRETLKPKAALRFAMK